MISINYKTLFEVNLYHDYFLDNGIDKFAAMYEEQRLVQLARYNVLDFLEIVPTLETQHKIVNQRMRLIKQPGGFRIMVSVEANPALPLLPTIPISDSFELRFMVKIKDEFFANYTDLPFESNRTYLFTNTSPYSGFPLIPLMPASEPTPDPLPDPPNPPTLPNIDDTFLANQDETEELLNNISLAEQIGLLGIFKITITNGSTDYDILTSDKEIKNDFVTFLVHILNLKRFWKYKKSQTNQVFKTKIKQPLVKYGYIELEGSDFNPEQQEPEPPPNTPYCYPNADVISIEKDGADIYSVIFI